MRSRDQPKTFYLRLLEKMGCGSSKLDAAMKKAGEEIAEAAIAAGTGLVVEVMKAGAEIAGEAVAVGKEIAGEAVEDAKEVVKKKIEEVKESVKEKLDEVAPEKLTEERKASGVQEQISREDEAVVGVDDDVPTPNVETL